MGAMYIERFRSEPEDYKTYEEWHDHRHEYYDLEGNILKNGIHDMQYEDVIIADPADEEGPAPTITVGDYIYEFAYKYHVCPDKRGFRWARPEYRMPEAVYDADIEEED